jgi:hypothetical protein
LNDCSYQCYFQNAFFAEEVKEKLYSKLRLKSKFEKEFRKKYPFVGTERYAVVHVRMGDYLQQQLYIDGKFTEWTLPFSWFLRNVAEHIPAGMRILIISDDMCAVKLQFTDLPNAEFPEDNLTNHFQLMLHADICLISNSTFSWWASFLNRVENRKVIAPMNWVGHNAGVEYPKGIMTDSFSWVY